MNKRDWLLLAIGERMEPIQLQKTLFKFAKESGAPAKQLYDFEPYNWGPCSFDIYDDLDELRSKGVVSVIPSGRGWNIYCLTGDGQRGATDIRSSADQSVLKKLDDTREYVVTRNFETLLQDVYKDYPQYAAKSFFRK